MLNAVPPDELLFSDRLRLEPLEPRHADALFKGLQSTAIYEFIADQPPTTIEALRARYQRLARRQSPDGTEIWLNWAVWSSVETGFIGFVQTTITPDRRAFVAYVFFPTAWGRGYAKEATSRMIAYLKHTWPDVECRACADVRNQRSIAMLGKLGFLPVTVRKNAEIINGLPSDEAEFRLALA